MNCNNCTNNNALKEVKIKHVHGNVLRMAIPLTLRTIELVDGEINATDTPFVPSSEHPVKVVFSKGSVSVALDATMKDGNIAYIEEKGKIPVGTYAITVTCNDDNGNPYRFKQNAVLYVADATIEAGIEETIEYEVMTWYLDAAIFLALKGEDGVGIDDIETQSSGEIGGVNTVTFILTDGRTRSFNILNGSGAVDSDLDINSPSPIANSAVTAKFNELAGELADLFGDVDYDTSSKTIRFWDKGKTNILASLDARPFIKDGMVSNAYISNNTLVITFNTDSGKEAIGVPLTTVFNPNNYYTKTQVDSRIASAVANINLSNYYTKSQVDSLYSSLSSRVTPVEVIFTESNDSITSNRTINGIYTDYTNKKPIIGKYGSSVGVLLYISSQEAAFLFGDRYDKPFILRNSGSTHWGKEDLVDDSSSIVIDAAPTPESDNAVSSGSVWYYLTQRIQSVTINGTTKTPDDNGNVNFTVQGGGGYTPPQGGIPKTDLASGVQSSLDAADSAYQKPNGGIPASDLSSAVQTSLNKADTALQSSDLEGYATTDDVDDAVAALVSSAPQTLDTLKELADALGDDPNFAATIATQLGNKVDKESGKSLMTDAERTKLAGIAAGAEVNVQSDWTQTTTTADDYIKNKPTLATVATSGSYNDLADKPTIPEGAVVDSSLSDTSTNAVQNKVVKAALDSKADSADIPTKVSDLTNDSGFIDKAMYYGTSTTAADTMPKVCTVDTFPTYEESGVTHAKEGTIIAVKFTNSDTNTTDAPTLNVNGIGAKAIMYNNAIVTSTAKNTTVAGTAKMLAYYRYDPDLDSGNGAWEYLGKSVDSNSTYSNASLGQGYATQNNESAATAVTAALSSYALTAGGIVSVKFTYDVPASATLNINGKGAKAMYNQGAAITAGVIKAGDTATFIYSTYYHLISVDRWQDDIADAKSYVVTISWDSTNNKWVCDKANAEIYDAWQAGRMVVCTDGDAIWMPLTSPTSGSASFANRDWEDTYEQVRIDISTTNGVQTVAKNSSSFQPRLAFDNEPTANSTNPVMSRGVYTALQGKANKNGDINESFSVGSIQLNALDGNTISVYAASDENGAAINLIEHRNGGELNYIFDDSGDTKTIATTDDLSNFVPTIVSTTHASLVTARTNSQLIAGAWYRITDYACTTTQDNTRSAGHQFDVLVLATSANTLSEEAMAIKHDGDTYFADANLDAWKIWYCLDNDTTRFAWADATNGKGVIYRMIDEWNNDCPYDFKNIQFKRYKVTATTKNDTSIVGKYMAASTHMENHTVDASDFVWCYTFNAYYASWHQEDEESGWIDYDNLGSVAVDMSNFDLSPFYNDNYYFSQRCEDNRMQPAFEDIRHRLNNIVIYGWVSDISTFPNNFKELYGDYIDEGVMSDCSSNTFGNNCSSNTFGNNCYSNTFGDGCYSNTFGNGCYSNTFGNGCYFNTFGDNCSSNTFGDNCSFNTFGNNCYSNTFGNNCSFNTFGNGCYFNTFGDNCSSNTFGDNCSFNTFGNNCYSNTFGNNCSFNTFGDGCNNNTFSKPYTQHVIVENGNKKITLTSTQTPTGTNPLRNITIAQGINNTNTIKTISHNTLNDTFRTTYTTDVNGNIYAITPTKYGEWDNKQSALVSGTNIKTVNNQSILGSGNLTPSQLGVPNIANNLTTTTTGSTLDATQGKALKDLIDGITVPSASTTTPVMDGTAAIGSSSEYAKADHVHPSDTSKANTSEMSVSTSGDQTTITLKTGTSATVINQHQSLSGYVQSSGVTNIVVCASESAYNDISPKDSNTLYLIKE